MIDALALRYARALAQVAERHGADAAAVGRELELFEQALEALPELKRALESPAVQRPRKRGVVTRLAGMLPLSDPVRKFLLVMIDHRRTALIGRIREAFEIVMDERLGVVRADVFSARELGAEARQGLVRELSQITGRQARARFAIRPELIGGVMARIGSTVYDGSVLGQLEALKHRLAEAEG